MKNVQLANSPSVIKQRVQCGLCFDCSFLSSLFLLKRGIFQIYLAGCHNYHSEKRKKGTQMAFWLRYG